VLILPVLFHQSIEIVDALSSEPVPGFNVHISPWRVLSEPFTGPLLFYLRADQAVKEFSMLLYWILAITLLLSVIKETKKLAGLLSWLKTAFLIVATWLALLWLIIYIPLPANTIVNQQEHSILINTHSHSEYSHDGIISTKGLQKWHKKNGFDAFFITEHNHHAHSMEAVKAQEQGSFLDIPLMMVGEEFSGSNHITLLGLKRNFITRGLTDQQVIDSTHDDRGVAIVAHWFDGENESIPYYLDMGVDGFEIANQAYGLAYEQRIFRDITETCISNGLLLVGAADYHGYGSSCFVWNALEIPGWHQMESGQKRESIMEVLRRKDMSKIRVLLYHDRNVSSRSLVILSPLFNFVNYFRTLNFVQVLSWIIWLVLLAILLKRLGRRTGGPVSFRIMQALALTGSVFLLVNGTLLKLKAPELKGYNDIYTEYSTLLLSCGTGFLIYSLILIFFELRRKSSINNQK
jgi:hypothetical protein